MRGDGTRAFTVLAHHFEEGGPPMYWVLTCSVLVMGIILRKLLHLYGPRPASGEVLARLERWLSVGDLGRAVSEMLHTRGELAYLAVGALASALHSDARVEAALAERLVLVRAPLRRGIGALFRLSQLATLFGLLGAIAGLQSGYSSVANADAHARATMLAAGISESMNCTAFGLLVSAVALGFGWLFEGRVRVLDADLEHAACALRNLLVRHRSQLRWLGARAPIERGSYRTAD